MINFKDYRVVETYLGKEINVNVFEYWDDYGIYGANISCNYSPIIQKLESKNSRLTVSDVHDAIFRKFYSAEKSICADMKEEHDNFYRTRHFKVLVNYKDQNISVGFAMKSKSDMMFLFCGASSSVKKVSLENNIYRDEIINEIEYFKRLINRGYVISEGSTIDRIKKKIKGHFH